MNREENASARERRNKVLDPAAVPDKPLAISSSVLVFQPVHFGADSPINVAIILATRSILAAQLDAGEDAALTLSVADNLDGAVEASGTVTRVTDPNVTVALHPPC